MITGLTVAVVTDFTGVEVAVAAALQSASGRATIADFGVAVIAGLEARFALGDIGALDAVATTRHSAIAGAGVDLHRVAVVAGLAMIDPAVAADLGCAMRRAAITDRGISIVTFLEAPLLGLQIAAQDAVTAARWHAGRGAGVGLLAVAIIAGLMTIDADVQIGAHDRIAATRHRAARKAGIVFDIIAIVAGLASLDDAVAAGRWDAVRTGVGGVVVAVIAALTGPDDAVTATGYQAIR
jgi:hypothetical protein